jgi:hypothetical protein
MPYGPCGTVSQIGERFLWANDHERKAYETAPQALEVAVADCEATYREDRADRKAAWAMNPGAR